MRSIAITYGNYTATEGATGGCLVLPVIPNEGIDISSQYNNQTYESLNGPLLLLGRRNLRTFSIQSFFPNKAYDFIYAGSGVIRRKARHETTNNLPGMNRSFGGGAYTTEIVQDGMACVEFIENVRAQLIPVRVIYTDNGEQVLNMACTINDFSWGFDASGDIGYTMSFTEYVFPQYNAAELGELEDPADAVETENKECDPSVFQTAAETTASSAEGYTRTAEANYIENDVLLMCRHIVSGMVCTQDTVYYSSANKKIWPTSNSSYNRPITAATLVSAEVWCVLNCADSEYPDKSLSAALPIMFNNVKFDYNSKVYSKYGDNYTSIWGFNFNLYNVCKTVLDQWSDEHAGNTVNRTLPAGYTSQWGSVANEGNITGPKNYGNVANGLIYGLVYYFKQSLYTTANKPWYGTAQKWIKSGEAWDFSVAY